MKRLLPSTVQRYLSHLRVGLVAVALPRHISWVYLVLSPRPKTRHASRPACDGRERGEEQRPARTPKSAAQQYFNASDAFSRAYSCQDRRAETAGEDVVKAGAESAQAGEQAGGVQTLLRALIYGGTAICYSAVGSG
eukprot:2528754-Pleurochrysis_carterae.AAC.4